MTTTKEIDYGFMKAHESCLKLARIEKEFETNPPVIVPAPPYKLNRSRVMKTAWSMKRSNPRISFSAYLVMAWSIERGLRNK